MSDINDDQKVVRDGRKNPLKDLKQSEEGPGSENKETEVEVPLRDQVVQKLRKKLLSDNIPVKMSQLWSAGNNDRSEWLSRQAEYITQVDEFINNIYAPSTDWGSALHLPTILTVCKTFHARMYAALTSVDPMFVVRARKEAEVDREKVVTDIMRYAIKDWSNNHVGVNDELDKWLWNWVTSGVGLLKCRWDRQFTRFVDVEEVPVQSMRIEIDQNGEAMPVMETVFEEQEIIRTIPVFEGPCIENVKIEDLLIVGGEGDPQKADAVIQQYYLTASELWQLVDQKIFDKACVEKIIAAGNNTKAGDQTMDLKQIRTELAGEGAVHKVHETQRYRILECYAKVDVDGSGITSDIIMWINPETNEMPRATYLWRVMRTGMRPFFKIDFHKRHGATYGVGMVELLYQLGKEIDAIHNIRVDIGILTSLPWGFYRPTSSTREEKLPIEPGTLVPLDNPQTDVYFPNLGNRTGFALQEEQLLQGIIERFTSLSDLSYGSIGGQGAARTASGVRALLGESNANLDIYLQRMNRGWKQTLKYIFHMLQAKVDTGFQFRLTGEDGKSYWETVQDRAVLQGMYDFELDPNTANSNKQIQIETANQIYQLTGNPIDLQLGLISPLERYEAIRNVLLVNGVRDASRYLRKPNQVMRQFSPVEIANRILAGMDVPLDPTQDLQGFITFVENFMQEDDLIGQFGPHEVAALQGKAQEASNMIQAMQQQQAQAASAQQQQLNAQATMTPSNLQGIGNIQGGGSEVQ